MKNLLEAIKIVKEQIPNFTDKLLKELHEAAFLELKKRKGLI